MNRRQYLPMYTYSDTTGATVEQETKPAHIHLLTPQVQLLNRRQHLPIYTYSDTTGAGVELKTIPAHIN